MTVNYIIEINKFTELAAELELSAAAQLLYLRLLHFFNKAAKGNEWPEKLPISTKKLLLYYPYGEDTLGKARKELQEVGLLDAAVARGRAGTQVYTMHYLCEGDCFDQIMADQTARITEETDEETAEEITEKIPDESPEKISEELPIKSPKKSADLSGKRRQLKAENPHSERADGRSKRKTQTVNQKQDDDDDDRVDRTGARAREGTREEALAYFGVMDDPPKNQTEAAKWAFERYFGTPPNIGQCQYLGNSAQVMGLNSRMVAHAIQKASLYGADNPIPYAIKSMRDWAQQGWTDPLQVPEFNPERQAEKERKQAVGDLPY